uniref:non-specific serine/threonine protein kinase n=1 Tax=Chromera velia CCMP2878 TaxID=1169474 RepID=A0A0G4HEG9_9ALVE|eukprot:Cvel_26763.t1-p1 / transcript=Cvel_26763.t1 / gene=Cvel_26763 / organism=Chromera_velia_CCMP2878 / gene_product=Sperm motility kinase X, putative / transcript_product=Sperm motility kinase X, putative / location=Cvel_scaffold3235:5476-7950(-) / protein_length=284 / sequence_SO=supercontig / SO=protein_coding / is_pseudo=false
MRLCVHLLCGLLALVCVSSHRILLREAEARQLDRLESHYENATDLGPVDLPDNHDEQERMEEDSNGSDYLEETLLGRGAFGTVWLAEHVKTGRKYALKKEDSHSGVEMEFSILQTFCSGRVPFFMRFKELLKECPAWAEPTNKSVCLVLGLAAGGEVQKRQDSVDGQVLYSWLLQSLAGIAYFHEAGFVHRDIKPENLFLDHKDRILVGDVGLSGKLDEDGLITGERGTAYYMAPEIWKEKPYGKPVDIFALGVTFHKLCSGSLPWNGHSKESIGKNIMFEPVS